MEESQQRLTRVIVEEAAGTSGFGGACQTVEKLVPIRQVDVATRRARKSSRRGRHWKSRRQNRVPPPTEWRMRMHTIRGQVDAE